jgi:hypothetical protein
MTKRQYYSMRMGKNPNASKLDLSILLKLFRELYTDFERRGYFQEAFGDSCGCRRNSWEIGLKCISTNFFNTSQRKPMADI